MLQELDYFTEPLPDPAVRLLMVQVTNMRFVLCLLCPQPRVSAPPCPRWNFVCAAMARFQSLRWLDNKKQLLVYYHAAQLNERQDSVLAALRQARGAPSPAGTRCVRVCVCVHTRASAFLIIFCVRVKRAGREAEKGD